MTKILEKYETVYQKGDKTILEIYDAKQELRKIAELVNEENFIKLLKMCSSDKATIRELLNTDFVPEYLKFIFDYADKVIYENNKCCIRCHHWTFQFNPDLTITAINDYCDNDYSTPYDVFKERSETEEYKHLHNANMYYSGKISFSVFLRKEGIKNQKYLWSNMPVYIKLKRDKTANTQALHDYEDETSRLMVQAKVEAEELLIQKKDYLYYTKKISRFLPNFRFVIKNPDFAEKIMNLKVGV